MPVGSSTKKLFDAVCAFSPIRLSEGHSQHSIIDDASMEERAVRSQECHAQQRARTPLEGSTRVARGFLALLILSLLTSPVAASAQSEWGVREATWVEATASGADSTDRELAAKRFEVIYVAASQDTTKVDVADLVGATARSFLSGDFDEDGTDDLVVGHAASDGPPGRLVLYRGNPAARRLAVTPLVPFLSPARVWSLKAVPDLLVCGDFDGDSHLDLVAAAQNGSALHLIAGDGIGGLRTTRSIELHGGVTAMLAGDLNWRDGLEDLAVAVDGEQGPELLLFEGPRGALHEAPEHIPLPAPARSMALGQLDSHFAIDLAIDAAGQLLVLRGRERSRPRFASQPTEEPILERIDLPVEVAAMTVAEITGDARRQEMVLLTAGSLHVVNYLDEGVNDKTADSSSPPAEAVSDAFDETGIVESVRLGPSVASPSRARPASSDSLAPDATPESRRWRSTAIARDLEFDDVRELLPTAALGLGGRSLLVRHHQGTAVLPMPEPDHLSSRRSRPALSVDTVGDISAILPQRLNGDAMQDAVILKADEAEPSLLISRGGGGAAVNSTLDNQDGDPADGICDTGSAMNGFTGICTLRAAIQTVNNNGGGSIVLAAGGTISPQIPLPDVTASITLSGDDTTRIDGSNCICAYELRFTSSNNTLTGVTFGDGANGTVRFEGSSENSITNNTFDPGMLHIISGGTSSVTNNEITGIVLIEGGSSGNTIQNNLFGTDGMVALGNGQLDIADSTNNSITNNVFGGGSIPHLRIRGALANGNTVRNNKVGTDQSGTAAIGGSANGIELKSPNNTVGGQSAGDRNIVSGNGSHGLAVLGVDAYDNRIEGNFIGVDVSGTMALGNGLDGLRIETGDDNLVLDNVISSNDDHGVRLANGADGTQILGNRIGTDAAGSLPLGNALHGVRLGGSNVQIGMPGAEANVISNNGGSGILGDSGTANRVEGNLIGTDLAGSAARGNNGEGIFLRTSDNVVIDNTVGANGCCGTVGHGVALQPAGSAGITGNVIQGNRIGVGADGSTPLGNVRFGVALNATTTLTTVGGTAPGEGNIIAYNAEGVVVPTGISNRILQNSIFDNGTGIGIDLFTAGPTANDPGDGDGGGNNRQNKPIISAASLEGSGSIEGSLNSTPNTAFRIELFSNSSCGSQGFGQGETFLGSVDVTTNASGDANFSAGFAGRNPTATATNLTTNDTSEFSSCFPLAPETYIVNSVGDQTDDGAGDGDCDTGGIVNRDGVPEAECTLRAAIEEANARSGLNRIEFDVPDAVLPTIVPFLLYDTISDAVELDAETQPNSGHVIVRGTQLGANGFGFVISAGASRVQGFFLQRFQQAAIRLQGSGGSTVRNNLIGRDITIPGNLGNGIGVDVVGSPNNTIADNTISGNRGQGILLQGSGAAFNLVSDNLLGTDSGSSPGLGNNIGVEIDNAPSNTVLDNVIVSNSVGVQLINTGTTGNEVDSNFIGTDRNNVTGLGNGNGVVVADAGGNTIVGNTIVANFTDGVEIGGGGAVGNQLLSNFIGTNAANANNLGNGRHGMLVTGAADNTFGAPGMGNVISGNGFSEQVGPGDGVRLTGGANGNLIQANFIGTSGAGTAPLANRRHGIVIQSSADNTIGGGANTTNIIAGNVVDGVQILGAAATGNVVDNNFIGTNSVDAAGLANLRHGILISNAAGNTVGGPLGNTISGNGTADTGTVIGSGVRIQGVAATDNVISGNDIGTNLAGDAPLANAQHGVHIHNAVGNEILSNLISGNGGSGILVSGFESFNNLIASNCIGVVRNGSAALHNGSHGVEFRSAGRNQLGDPQLLPNLISGNSHVGSHGVLITGNGTPSGQPVGESPLGQVVLGNYIGTDVDGAFAVPNAVDGVHIKDSNGNLIGGSGPGEGNLISGNQRNGVWIEGNSLFNPVRGNSIGTTASGQFAVANQAHGVRIDGNENPVGGELPGQGNRIAFNAGRGVVIGAGELGTAGLRNRIRGNSITNNGSIGIDLEGGSEQASGVTQNDRGDVDGLNQGPNFLRNFPVLQQVTIGPGGTFTLIRGVLDSRPSREYVIEFFDAGVCDASGFGEGDVLLGSTRVTTNGSGFGTFYGVFKSVPQVITATTTDLLIAGAGNTSEFSQCKTGVAVQEPVLNEVDAVSQNQELIEISSSGVTFQSLDGKVLVLYDGATDTSYAAFDLDGLTTDGAGYFVAGSAATPSVDLVLAEGLLVDGPAAVALYEGDADDFPNGTAVTTANLVDAFVYGPAASPDAGLLVLLEINQPQVDEAAAGNALLRSSQRCPDSSGGQRFTDTYAQSEPTPGAANQCAVCRLEPPFSAGEPGGSHDVAVTVLSNRITTVENVDVNLAITSGPQTGTAETLSTDSNGQAVFSYTSDGSRGTDVLTASGNINGSPFSCQATRTWGLPEIFADGFESGDTSRWSASVGH